MANKIQFLRKPTILENRAAAIDALNSVLFYAAMPASIGYLGEDGSTKHYILALGMPDLPAEGSTGANAYYVACDTLDDELLSRIKIDGDGTKVLADNGQYITIEPGGVVSVNGKSGIVSVIEGITEEIVTVTGVSWGNLSDGAVIPKGKTFTEVLKMALLKRIAPTYTQPSVAMTNPTTANIEAGETLNVNASSTFTPGDAGAVTSHKLTRKVGTAAVEDVSTGVGNTVTFKDDATVIGDAAIDSPIVYASTCTYAEGPIKKDNMGDDSPAGHILAGTKSSAARTLTGKRKMFYGAFASKQTFNSAVIRGMQAFLAPVANTKIDYAQFNVSAGASQFAIALPKSYGRGLKSVTQYAGGFKLDVTASFVKQGTAIKVEGANAYTAVDYDIYVWDSSAPFGSDDSFEIVLS